MRPSEIVTSLNASATTLEQSSKPAPADVPAVPAYLPQLDALRGIAILLVIFHNQSMKYPSLHLDGIFANGWMGVDLFFVLSGLLITGILLDARKSDGYFKNFYARRCLRIWPLYYAVIFFMFVVVPLALPSKAPVVWQRSSPWWSYPLFLQNLLVARPTQATGPLGVTWSLAIEEQFYLVWPWVVRYSSHRQLRRIALGVICLSPVLRLYLSSLGIDLYSNTICRLDGLMAGAFVAGVIRSDGFRPAEFVGGAWTGLLVGLPLAFAAEALQLRWIGFSLVALASASLVYLALFSKGPMQRILTTNRFLISTGTISYGLYLLHKIPFDVAEAIGLDRYPALTLLLGVVACYVAAAVSWVVLERPTLRLKRFFYPETVKARQPGPAVTGSSTLAGHA